MAAVSAQVCVRMEIDQARSLLNRIPALQCPSDVDLLVFFAKHPRTLMTSDQLARLLGYQLNELARSLDVLLAAGLLTRSQNPSLAARLYVFVLDSANPRWAAELVQVASSREGRLALRRALIHAAAEPTERRRRQGTDDETVQAGVQPIAGLAQVGDVAPGA
jgi:DNA-binding MarR family transcriptional regulator